MTVKIQVHPVEADAFYPAGTITFNCPDLLEEVVEVPISYDFFELIEDSYIERALELFKKDQQ